MGDQQCPRPADGDAGGPSMTRAGSPLMGVPGGGVSVSVGEAAWRIHTSRWFAHLRVWSPTVAILLGFVAAVLGVMPAIPGFDRLPVWLSVLVLFVGVHAVVELVPWLAGRLWPEPRREVLRVNGDTLRLRLERELDVPLAQLRRVRASPFATILIAPLLRVTLERTDGSVFRVRTDVADRRLFRALAGVDRRLRGGPGARGGPA